MDVKSTHTYAEIMQQPAMWLDELERIMKERSRIADFMRAHSDYEIILTGAGTSAFIGDALSVALLMKGCHNCRAVATTDIITHAEAYFSGRNILLVSFARSGNSPESVGTVNLANRLCKQVAHVFITCNADGALARMAAGSSNTLLLLLPPRTNDLSLAMTSSFSTMCMACLMLFDIEHLDSVRPQLEAAAANARHILDHYSNALEALVGRAYDRAVFLGSGPLCGIAEECHLKQQELTDGAVICKFDSFLAFRHGPKAVVKPSSVLVYLVSDREEVQRYERDLIRQINANNHVTAQVAVMMGEGMNLPGIDFDISIVMPNSLDATGAYGYIPYVLVGQLMGLYKSVAMGLDPDAPSISGNIARVVEGVTIYE